VSAKAAQRSAVLPAPPSSTGVGSRVRGRRYLPGSDFKAKQTRITSTRPLKSGLSRNSAERMLPPGEVVPIGTTATNVFQLFYRTRAPHALRSLSTAGPISGPCVRRRLGASLDVDALVLANVPPDLDFVGVPRLTCPNAPFFKASRKIGRLPEKRQTFSGKWEARSLRL
jgi:hypothetical protein